MNLFQERTRPKIQSLPGRILYYRKNDQMPVEEDEHHEFKCHTAIAKEDLPPWSQESGGRTKRAISRSLNAFLNGEKGGTVYLGVADTGLIIGLELTLFQKDHLRVNLDNLMKRYKPCVPEDRYRIRFVPVISKDESEDDAARIFLSINREDKSADTTERQRSHLCQTHDPCWCLLECKSKYLNEGIPVQAYVVEIQIRPWNQQQWNYVTPKVNIQPFHCNEEGMVFIRTIASVRQYTDQEIMYWTRKKVAKFYQERIKAIQT